MAGKVSDIAALFGQQIVDQAKATAQKQIADAQVVASMVNLRGGLEQFKADMATRAAEAHAAGQTGPGPAPEPPMPDIPLPDVRNPQGSLPNILSLPQAVTAAGPGGVQGGAAVQAGLKDTGGGGMPSIPAPPPTITSQENTTQYARNEASPFLTEFVPLPVQTTRTTQNAMTPGQYVEAQLQVRRQQMIERQQRAEVTLNLLKEGYGADSAKVVDAIFTGDTAAYGKLLAGKTPLSQKHTEALIAAENARAGLYRQEISASQVDSAVKIATLMQTIGDTPFSVRNGLRSGVAARKGAMTDNQLVSQWAAIHDKDGNIKPGSEVSQAQLAIEWSDRGFLALQEPSGFLSNITGNKGKAVPVPMAPLINLAIGAETGSGSSKAAAIKTLVDTKLFKPVKNSNGEIDFEPADGLDPVITSILNGIKNDGKFRATLAAKTGADTKAQEPPPPPTPPAPTPAAPKSAAQVRGEKAGAAFVGDFAKMRRENQAKAAEEDRKRREAARSQQEQVRGFFQGILDELNK